MKIKTNGTRLGLDLLGSPNALQDSDYIHPPWIWNVNGTRRHFYEDHAYTTPVVVKSVRFHDVEGCERIRWKVAGRERKAFSNWQAGYRQIQKVKKARCLSKDGSYVVEYNCNEHGISNAIKRKSTKLLHEERARFFNNAEASWNFWSTGLRKVDSVLLRSIDNAVPKEIAHSDRERVVILPINGREYVFLCKRNRGEMVFHPFSFPMPGEVPPVMRFVGDYAAILVAAMTQTMPRPRVVYNVRAETISSIPA